MRCTIASNPCDSKRPLRDVPLQVLLATVAVVETIGQRITRLRNGKDWSRPELGRQMAAALGRKKPFSGELIRLYEEDINRPSVEARQALAKVFSKAEQYIEFGSAPGAAHVGESLPAEYDSKIKRGPSTVQTEAEKLLVLIKTFLDTDAEGRKELLDAATSVSEAHATTARAARRGTKRR